MPEVDPALAALSLWCVHRDGPVRTHTKGDTIYYGAEFPLLPISEQIGLLAHHVLHVALRHSQRRADMGTRMSDSFQAELYDLACDALVNEVLIQAKHALPRPAVRAADLVALLPADKRPTNVVAEWDCERLYLEMSSSAPAMGRDTGEAVRNYARRQSFESDLSDDSAEQQEADLWAGRIEQALSTGRGAGTGIGTVLAQFGDLPRAEIPWEIRLRRLMKKALTQHPRRNHRRPERAWLAREAWARLDGGPQPVFQPGLTRDTTQPRIVIGIDTSSSITQVELGLFASEALSLSRQSGAEVHLLGFDTEVHFRGRLDHRQSFVEVEMRRDGGTDYEAVLTEAQSLDPSLIVMLTDLDAAMTFVPSAPIIWVAATQRGQTPPVGDVILRS